MAHQERERRLALSKAYVLEPGPLIGFGAGYAVREWKSRNRRRRYNRNL